MVSGILPSFFFSELRWSSMEQHPSSVLGKKSKNGLTTIVKCKMALEKVGKFRRASMGNGSGGLGFFRGFESWSFEAIWFQTVGNGRFFYTDFTNSYRKNAKWCLGFHEAFFASERREPSV